MTISFPRCRYIIVAHSQKTSFYYFFAIIFVVYMAISPTNYLISDVDKFKNKNLKERSKALTFGINFNDVDCEHRRLAEFMAQWKYWAISGILTVLMITDFCHLAKINMMHQTFMIEFCQYSKILCFGFSIYKIFKIYRFCNPNVWLMINVERSYFSENPVGNYIEIIFKQCDALRFLITYHRLISFSMYCVGFVWFVLSLKKKYYMRQFSLFAWTHVALLIVVTQSYLIIINIFHGMIWFIVPVSMIVINDVMAYMFGFFFGKTPLIQLSPKKTWEGFIGGGISTVFMGMGLSYFLCQYPFFVCPVEYVESEENFKYICEPAAIFRTQDYNFPETVANVFALFGWRKTISLQPFVLHSISLSLFSSSIGPFGGFFASGFKRAFKIKDFGDVIPGHGGMMDRFDCQYLMATFVNVYILTFVSEASPQKLLQKVYMLTPDHQLQLYNMLQDSLIARGILQP
ncbi:unnamed protein product, partial [Meganyctiphanes norvegica]